MTLPPESARRSEFQNSCVAKCCAFNRKRFDPDRLILLGFWELDFEGLVSLAGRSPASPWPKANAAYTDMGYENIIGMQERRMV